jgi:hypothetical protein
MAHLGLNPKKVFRNLPVARLYELVRPNAVEGPVGGCVGPLILNGSGRPEQKRTPTVATPWRPATRVHCGQ